MDLERDVIANLRQQFSAASDLTSLVRSAQNAVSALYPTGLASIVWEGGIQTLAPGSDHPYIELKDGATWAGGVEIPAPLIVSDILRAGLPSQVIKRLSQLGVRSLAVAPIYVAGTLKGCIEVIFLREYFRFRREDGQMLDLIALLTSMRAEALTKTNGAPPPEPESAAAPRERDVYDRIARYGNLIIVRTDRALRVHDVAGDTTKVLGVSREDLLANPRLWRRLLNRSDLRRLVSHVRSHGAIELTEEIRITHLGNGAERLILVRAIPVTDASGAVTGWEGFGVDITEREEAESRARAQGKRIEALYEVARSLELNLDPGVVALKGLRALIKATGSHCGLSCLADAHSGNLEIVASEGLSPAYIEALGKVISTKTLARYAVERREGFFVDDIQQDPRAAAELAKAEGLHSTIIMPLLFEQSVLGVMVLFRRDFVRYSAEDYELVVAACSQIAMAARQAELYAAERRQASSFSALYRLSHELAKQISIREVAEQAFPAIQEEIACKRMWLGVLNQRGTHLEGQAGVGPGIRKSTIELQIELSPQQKLLNDAISKRAPVVVEPAALEECPDLGRHLGRLNCGTLVIVPLVSLGQVVGVLVVEPAFGSQYFLQRKLPLLNSMATEIATVILARKFEARMAEADKMRMAGLLASGVAHNFNNLLQAVMGQAALIEMQTADDPRVSSAARMISEAASRGALLVKQLFSFSMQGSFAPRPSSLGEILTSARDLYQSLLTPQITLEMETAEGCPQVMADPAPLQTVITNLLVNAKEALSDRKDGTVRIVAQKVKVRSGEVDPELAPGTYVRIDIEDNGVGMTPEVELRCFEPFFTTKNTDVRTGLGFGGSGLGLSSAYSIMKQHEGLITVRSQPGAGTTFSLFIPVVPASVSEEAIERVPATVKPALRIAIVDTDQATAFSIRSAVEAPDAQILTPYSRERFVEQLIRDAYLPTLVIADFDRIGNHVESFLARLSEQVLTGDRAASFQLVGLVGDLARYSAIAARYSFVELHEKPVKIWTLSEKTTRLKQQESPLQAPHTVLSAAPAAVVNVGVTDEH